MLNEILGPAARFQQLLTRKFGLIGGSPSPQLTPEITPEYHLDNAPEDRILGSDFYAAGVIDVPADAGHPSQAALYNPGGSGQVLILEQVELTLMTAGTAGIGMGVEGVYALNPLGIAAAAGARIIRDTRVTNVGFVTRLPTGIVGGENGAAAVINPSLVSTVLTTLIPYRYSLPVIVAPGWLLKAITGANNLQLRAAFNWREVPISKSEAGPF